jgi:hypothetical protein
MGDYVANIGTISYTGKQNAFRWYNPAESTVYAEGNFNGLYGSSGYNRLVSFDSGTGDGSVVNFRENTLNNVYNGIYGNSTQYAFGRFSITNGSVFKNALRFATNDVKGYSLNASNASTNHLTDTSSTTPQLAHLGLGTDGSTQSSQANGHVRKFTYWPVGLTNTELSNLTLPASVQSVGKPADKTYIVGENLDFSLTFDKAITVTGTPLLPLTVGSSAVNANYISGTGTTTLVFRYTVQAGDLDSDGIAVASALVLNGSTLAEISENSASLSVPAVVTTGIKVDTIAPSVQTVTPPGALTYSPAQNANLDFSLAFNESVLVTGTPLCTCGFHQG